MLVTSTNRVEKYFDRDECESEHPLPETPVDKRERSEYWDESVFLALGTLRNQLQSPNENVRVKAAHKIIDLERTHLRHGRRIDGTGDGTKTRAEYYEEIAESTGCLPREMKPAEAESAPLAPVLDLPREAS